jgi:hypothetical protein
VEKMLVNNLNDEEANFLQYLNNQILLNKGGLLVRVHNVDLCRYCKKLGNLKPLEFGKNGA